LGMEQRHRQQNEELKSKHATELGALSDELAQRDQELAGARAPISKLEGELLQSVQKGEDLGEQPTAARGESAARNTRPGGQGARPRNATPGWASRRPRSRIGSGRTPASRIRF